MKISSDTIGNPNRNLPACGAVPQPSALGGINFTKGKFFFCATAISITVFTLSAITHCVTVDVGISYPNI